MSGPMYSAPPIELYQFLLQYLEAKFPLKCESKTIGGKKLHKAKVSKSIQPKSALAFRLTYGLNPWCSYKSVLYYLEN